MTENQPTAKAVKSRRAIQNILKQNGPMEAPELAVQLGITAMAVRQHLYAMQEELLIEFENIPRPKGRPGKLWKLTSEANKIFPDAHAELTIGLIEVIRDTFGEDGIEKLLEKRALNQTKAYQNQLLKNTSLHSQIEDLAAIRSREGYMAAYEANKDGSYLFIENHCPICAAATSCSGLCAMEFNVFQAVLGENASIERTDHILAGARRCAYLITPTS